MARKSAKKTPKKSSSSPRTPGYPSRRTPCQLARYYRTKCKASKKASNRKPSEWNKAVGKAAKAVSGSGKTFNNATERMQAVMKQAKALYGEGGKKAAKGGKKSSSKKAAKGGKKSAGRKSAGRKSAGRKSAGRKSAGRKASGKKASGKKASGKKASGKKASGGKRGRPRKQ